jgi:hypothetical protein
LDIQKAKEEKARLDAQGASHVSERWLAKALDLFNSCSEWDIRSDNTLVSRECFLLNNSTKIWSKDLNQNNFSLVRTLISNLHPIIAREDELAVAPPISSRTGKGATRFASLILSFVSATNGLKEYKTAEMQKYTGENPARGSKWNGINISIIGIRHVDHHTL